MEPTPPNSALAQPRELPRRSMLPGAVLFSLISIVLAFLIGMWDPLRPSFSPAVSLWIATLAIIAHYALCGRRLGAFDPGIWIPVIFYLHYFGMGIAIEVIPDSGFYSYDVYEKNLPRISQGIAAALLTVTSYLAGFHFVSLSDMNSPPRPPRSDQKTVSTEAHVLLWGGLAMITIGIPIVGTSVLFGHYGEMKEATKFGTVDYRLIGAGFFFATGGFCGVLASASKPLRQGTLVAMWAAVPIAIFLLMTGDRTGLSVLTFAGGWVFTQRITRVPKSFVIAGFIAMFLIMPIVKEYRTYRNLEDANRMSVGQLAAATFYEMGSSVQVFSWTLDQIPRYKDYAWGKSAFVAFVDQIPNFGFVAGRRFVEFDPIFDHPSKWVTWVGDPVKYYNAGGGYGYAVGAEWYFNFGVPGIVFGMAFLGWLTAYTRNHSRDGPWRLLLAAFMFMFMVNVVRNSVGYPFRSSAWPLVGYLFLGQVFKLFRGLR